MGMEIMVMMIMDMGEDTMGDMEGMEEDIMVEDMEGMIMGMVDMEAMITGLEETMEMEIKQTEGQMLGKKLVEEEMKENILTKEISLSILE